MSPNHSHEVWKTIHFDFEHTSDGRIEVSNLGRLRTFNKLSDGRILNGSMIKGYRIVRLKFFKPREPSTEAQLLALKSQVKKYSKEVSALKQSGASDRQLSEATELLQALKKNVSKKFKDDLDRRTIHYHSLVHKLVAEYFCERPSPAHTVVAHLDYNKMNNRSNNLKWMTPDENFEHQQKSPHVIEAKKQRSENLKEKPTNAKLSVTKVMLLKKLLNSGKPIRTLVKQFKITETQILRIKRGENWGHIEAAK